MSQHSTSNPNPQPFPGAEPMHGASAFAFHFVRRFAERMAVRAVMAAILGLIYFVAGCGDTGTSPELSGTIHYAAWAYDGEGLAVIDDDLQGLILMRDAASMSSLGGSRFDDGLGNLVVLGAFVSADAAAEGRYALTFVKEGGTQLALDFEDDRIAEAVFDITPEGHLGIIGNIEFESKIDCIARRMIDGEDPLAAVNGCLGLFTDLTGVVGGSGAIGPTGGEYHRLAEPDCGSAGTSGFLGAVSESPNGEWKRHGPWGPEFGDGQAVSGVSWTRPNEAPGMPPDTIDQVQIQDIASGDTTQITTETDIHEDGSFTRTTTTHTTEYLSNGETRVSETTHVNGRKVASSTSYYKTSTGECVSGTCAETVDDAEDPSNANAGGSEASSGAHGGTDSSQPGPNCELDGNCPFTDPRCVGPNNDMEALWDCIARTGESPMECLARLNDAVYATTGCMTVPGPSGQPELQCPRSDADDAADCLAHGEAIDGCFGDGMGGYSENDDLLGTFRSRGSSDIAYLDYTGIGGILLGFCDEGVEQLCGGQPAF
jgi:hypothetical protein